MPPRLLFSKRSRSALASTKQKPGRPLADSPRTRLRTAHPRPGRLCALHAAPLRHHVTRISNATSCDETRYKTHELLDPRESIQAWVAPSVSPFPQQRAAARRRRRPHGSRPPRAPCSLAMVLGGARHATLERRQIRHTPRSLPNRRPPIAVTTPVPRPFLLRAAVWNERASEPHTGGPHRSRRAELGRSVCSARSIAAWACDGSQ